MCILTMYEFFREIKNCFISLFIAGLCLLIAILYSFLDYENGKLKPFESLVGKSGFVAYDLIENNLESDNYGRKIDISEYDGIEKEIICYNSFFSLGDKSVSSYVYDSFVWSNWHARLKEGRWFSQSDINKKVIPIVVGGDTRGFNVGDVFEINYDGVEAKIIGILQDNTEIYNLETYDVYNFNYTEFYKAPNYKDGTVFAICQHEAMEKIGIVVSDNLYGGIYIYDENISQEEKNKLDSKLFFYGDESGKSLEAFLKESRIIARQKIYTYIPTIVVTLLIMIVSVYCISYVKIQKNGKIYSIYYLNGASKKTLYGLVFGYVIITIFFSALFYFIGGLWFDYYARQHNIMYSFWGNSFVVPAVLYLIFGITMTACLIMELKNKTAVQLIKEKKI